MSHISRSTIWEIVGGVFGIVGMVCFALSSTYQRLFGNLSFPNGLFSVVIALFMVFLNIVAKRTPVPRTMQGLMAALFFVVIIVPSVVHDKIMAGESDALTIISTGSFALMSLSMSIKQHLGFESGFTTFFLQFFALQLFQMKRLFLFIGLVFCCVIIILRHHFSESQVKVIGDKKFLVEFCMYFMLFSKYMSSF